MEIKKILNKEMLVTGTMVWILFIMAMIALVPVIATLLYQEITMIKGPYIRNINASDFLAIIVWIIIIGIPGVIIIKRFYSQLDFFDVLAAGILSFSILSVSFWCLDSLYETIQPKRLDKVSDNFSPGITIAEKIVSARKIDSEEFKSCQIQPSQYSRLAKLLGVSEWDVEIRFDPKNWETKETLHFKGD